jgi:integrase
MYEARTPLDNAPVFVDAKEEPPKPDCMSKRFKFYVRKVKLADREDLSFHSCRHTTGSWLSISGDFRDSWALQYTGHGDV